MSNFLNISSFQSNFYFTVYLFIFSILFIIPMAILGPNTFEETYQFLGGSIGLVSSSIVMLSYFYSPTGNATMTLLFWKSFCDFGLAIRFIANRGFNYYVCGESICFLNNTNQFDQQYKCSLPSGMLQFFEMAAEGWLLCTGFDLFFSIYRPFSSFNARIKYYHYFVWTFAACMSIPVISSEKLHGFWYINQTIQQEGLCWIKIQDNSAGPISYKPWVLFYIPLVTIYLICMGILFMAYQRLQHGISKTISHRMKILIINTVNLLFCLLYWFFIFILYLLVNYLKVPSSARGAYYALLYMIAGKGVSGAAVWFLLGNINFNSSPSPSTLPSSTINLLTDSNNNNNNNNNNTTTTTASVSSSSSISKRISLTPSSSISINNNNNNNNNKNNNNTPPKNDERLDLNSALRQEILQYITKGIQMCAREPLMTSNEDIMVKRLLRAKEENVVSWSLFFLLSVAFGFNSIENINQTQKTQQQQQLLQTKQSATQQQQLQLQQQSQVNPNQTQQQQPNHTDKPMIRSQSSSLSQSTSSSLSHPRIRGISHSIIPGLSSFNLAFNDIEEQGTELKGMRNSVDDLSARQTVFRRLINRPRESTFNGNINFEEEEQVEFTEYSPKHFRRIRQSVDLTSDDYQQSFATTIKERLADGGASGAFFFFSQGERFIAKSCSEDEALFLHRNAEKYANYLVTNKDSYLSRIYGTYKLRIYNTSLFFFVMNNIFLTPDQSMIHEKYDIKGSWVQRNASLPREGQMATCRHCEQKYIYTRKTKASRQQQQNQSITAFNTSSSTSSSSSASSSSLNSTTNLNRSSGSSSSSSSNNNNNNNIDNNNNSSSSSSPVNWSVNPLNANQTNVKSSFPTSILSFDSSLPRPSLTNDQDPNEFCKFTVNGNHEPSVIFKDNDLKFKIKLPNDVSRNLSLQLKKDADFLCNELGVMDYSLLVGVQNAEYEVEVQSVDSSSYPLSYPLSSPENNNKPQPQHSQHVVDRIVGPSLYYMGIIDFLQTWNLSKKFERALKIMFHGADPAGLSAVDCPTYRERFVKHIEDLISMEDPDTYL